MNYPPWPAQPVRTRPHKRAKGPMDRSLSNEWSLAVQVLNVTAEVKCRFELWYPILVRGSVYLHCLVANGMYQIIGLWT